MFKQENLISDKPSLLISTISDMLIAFSLLGKDYMHSQFLVTISYNNWYRNSALSSLNLKW